MIVGINKPTINIYMSDVYVQIEKSNVTKKLITKALYVLKNSEKIADTNTKSNKAFVYINRVLVKKRMVDLLKTRVKEGNEKINGKE